jgi:hypothetical protein
VCLTSPTALASLDPMAAPLTDQQLLQYSEEHLMHELSMLWETADALPRHKAGSVEYTALLESFATHLRNLIEFFFFAEDSDYVRAKHFFDHPAAWSPKKTPEMNKLHGRASNEVSHLTTRRISGNPPEKDWHITQILGEIETVARDFAAKASDKKLHPKIREFLKQPSKEMLVWIGNNVTHSNVASYMIVSTFPSVSVSTPTQIILKKP